MSSWTLQPGSVLCLMTLPYLALHSFYYLTARRPTSKPRRTHVTNALVALGFIALAYGGAGTTWDDSELLLIARLWVPIIFFWWAYAWSGRVLHVYRAPEFSYDDPIIAFEDRWFGQPALWMARGRPLWLNEAMNTFYFSYYFYTPFLLIALYTAGRVREVEALALAVNLGYTITYSIYPFTPLWGPRWALVDHGRLTREERILEGYWVTRFMNSIMYADVAHKGGAMPSAHSSTCVIFVIWCARAWGEPGLVVGALIGALMWVSSVYGRYHYVVDVLVGCAIGAAALWIADLTLL